METVKERLIREAEEGKGLGARLGKRELDYVRSLWRGKDIRKSKTNEQTTNNLRTNEGDDDG